MAGKSAPRFWRRAGLRSKGRVCFSSSRKNKELYFLEIKGRSQYAKSILCDRKSGSLMFLDNLSASLLQLCDAEHLSYERASERCKCSSKHFANIVCKRTHPSLVVFEHICLGFHETPNHLLGIEESDHAYRTPMPVTEIRVFPAMTGSPAFPVCPRCGVTMELEYPDYCSRCGQRLSWAHYRNARIVIRT